MLFAATVTVDGLGMGVLFKLIVHVHYHYLTSPLILLSASQKEVVLILRCIICTPHFLL